jgi:hypothetical protein
MASQRGFRLLPRGLIDIGTDDVFVLAVGQAVKTGGRSVLLGLLRRLYTAPVLSLKTAALITSPGGLTEMPRFTRS